MNYPIYHDINHKRFEVLNAPASLIKEYDNWRGEDKDFVKKFHPWIGTDGCSSKLGLSRNRASYLAKRTGVTIKKEVYQLSNMSSYSYSNFIKNPNPVTAYIMGFLWADGTVGAKKWEDRCDNQVTLGIKEEDFSLIRSHFEAQANWSFYPCVRGGNRKNRLDATISDILLKKFFYEMDYHKKSNSIGPSKILDFLGWDLQSHFVRGWFDGDGSFATNKKRVSNNKVTFTSNKEENWESLSEIFDKLKIKHSISRTDHNSHIVITNQDGFNKIFDYMYAQDEGVFLPRKKKRFLDYQARMEASLENQSSRYRGVIKSKSGKWLMQFRSRFASKKIIRKTFNNELDAAKEYDRLSLKYIGEKAHLNFEY